MNSELLNFTPSNATFTQEEWKLIENEIALEAFADREGWQHIDDTYFLYEGICFRYEDFVVINPEWEELEDIPNIQTEKDVRRAKNRRRQHSRRLTRQRHAFNKTTLKWAKKYIESCFESQSGFTSLIDNGYTTLARGWRDVCMRATEPGYDQVLNMGENIILLILALKDCRTVTQFVAVITMYVKLHTKDQSIVQQVCSLICDQDFADAGSLFRDDAQRAYNATHGFEDTTMGEEEKDWTSQSDVNLFGEMLSGFHVIKGSPLMEKGLKLISTLLALGFISESKELSYSANGMDIFRIQAAKGHKNAFDLIEVILSTMKFFVERGWKCFTTASLNPILYDDDAAWLFQEKYLRVTTNFDFVKLGTWKGQNAKCPWSSELDFDYDLTQTTDDCRMICKSCSKQDRILMTRCLERLLKLRTDFELIRSSGGLREAPFSFCVFGKSGVAKSTIVNNLISFALQTYAFETGDKDYQVDPKSICTLNELDKYHSDYKSHILAVLMDDFANAKPATTDVNPTVNVINFINNVSRTAIMAEADLKGKIQIRPNVVAATTNVKELNASYYSNEPVSILRRFPLHIEASVLPEYKKTLDTAFIDGRLLAKDAANDILFPNAWTFKCYEFYDPRDESNTGKAYMERPLTFKDKNEDGEVVEKVATDIGVRDLLLLMRQMIKEHVFIQKSVVDSSKRIFSKKLCSKCGMHQEYCFCKADSQAGYRTEPKMPREHSSTTPTSTFEFKRLYNEFNSAKKWFAWENFIPDEEFCKARTQYIVTWLKSREFFRQFFSFSVISFLVSTVMAPFSLLSNLGFQIVLNAAAIRARKEYVIRKITESREFLPTIVKNIRDSDALKGKNIFYFAAAVVAIYFLYKTIQRLQRTQMTPQGNQFSVHMEKENVWLQPVVEPLPKTDKNVSGEDLILAVQKQLVRVELGSSYCNGLFVGSNKLLIPGHEMPTEATRLSVRRDDKHVLNGHNFDCLIDPTDCVKVGDADLCLVYVPRSGDKKDLLPFFPDKLTTGKLITDVLYRDEGGTIIRDKTRIMKYTQVTTKDADFSGGICTYSKPTFGGQCMSPHIYSAAMSFIVGFHAAGVSGTPQGAITQCTKRDLQEAIDTLAARTPVVFANHSGTMSTESYGIDFTPRAVIEPKSPLNYQEKAQVAHFGTMPSGRIRPNSKVIVSPASTAVEKVTGNKRIHGKPANCRKPGVDEGNAVKSWDPYQKYIAGAGNAYQEFPASVLEWAYNDYISEIDYLNKTNYGRSLLDKVKVLDDVETVSGIDGLKFVDAMKPSTSMGWPVNKAKSNFMVELEPLEHCACPRAMDSETLELAAAAREKWLDGQRSYEVFKACTKDEPTKITKDKVRCFQAAPVSLQMNLRKYFLTMCHYLSMASLTSECAVGINAQGRGWHELNEHMTKFGTSRIVAGDFKAYDQHMSARMTLLSYKVFEHIGKAAGYTDEDLKIMRGAATEVCYPVMSLNGELIQLFGSNPSGQNLTVYTNSIVNSLYHRCAFRMIYPQFKGRFSEVVALMTYGDDVKMSVHKDFSEYNHTNIQEQFAAQGIQYTMADKDAASVPFIEHADADFLKRKSRWEPRYSYRDSYGDIQSGMWIAMLDEESIFKSLHSNLASNVETPEAVAIQCIEGAMREWWFFGKEHFERRHEQMIEVLESCGWTNFVSDRFWDSYEIRETSWLENNECWIE